jgi:hypothetical protein
MTVSPAVMRDAAKARRPLPLRNDATRFHHLNFRSAHREAIKHTSDGSPWIVPEKRRKKAIRTENCLSEASFFRSAFF